MRAVARAHEVSLSTVQWWCRRAGDLALDRVDWRDRPPIAARIRRTASAVARIDGAPERRPFPPTWQPDLQAQPDGVVMFIRRTSATGTVNLLGRTFQADPLWPHRLVRCEVDLRADTVRFHALRRREPTHHPLLGQAPYVFPRKPFHE
jgi:hypothetical protein